MIVLMIICDKKCKPVSLKVIFNYEVEHNFYPRLHTFIYMCIYINNGVFSQSM